MTKKSSAAKTFLESLVGYKDHLQVFNDCAPTALDHDILLFCDASNDRFGGASNSLFVIGGRSGTLPISKIPVLSDCFEYAEKDKKHILSIALKSRGIFVFPAGDKVAAVYGGLLASCGLGIMALFDYSPEYALALKEQFRGGYFRGVEYSELFERYGSAVYDADKTVSLMHSLSEFEKNILTACGKDGVASGENEGYSLLRAIYASASLIGCNARIGHYGELRDIDRDCYPTMTAILLPLFSEIRRISPDRSVSISVSASGEEQRIFFSFEVEKQYLRERIPSIEFCRELSEQYMIPFSFAVTDEGGVASLIPSKIDPSKSGFKASIIFDVDRLPDSES